MLIKKLYYTPKEVSNIVSVSPLRIARWCVTYNIRIKKRDSRGHRKFNNHELNLMLLIKKLLYTYNYSSKRVKKIIKGLKK